MRLALYQPEIPQNTGTLMRLSACLDVAIDIIEPCGFIMNDRRMKRAGMDYIDKVNMTRHNSWMDFKQTNSDKRIILLDPVGETSFIEFLFKPHDILLMGKESTGVPDSVAKTCDHSVFIPMQSGFRSINVAIAASMVLSEALRQTNNFPRGDKCK